MYRRNLSVSPEFWREMAARADKEAMQSTLDYAKGICSGLAIAYRNVAIQLEKEQEKHHAAR